MRDRNKGRQDGLSKEKEEADRNTERMKEERTLKKKERSGRLKPDCWIKRRKKDVQGSGQKADKPPTT